MPTVYIVEAQALFAPELARLASAAGARLAGTSEVLDLDELIAAKPDLVVLDLDFTGYDIADVLDVLHAEAPAIRSVVLTGERERGWLESARAAGAASVLSKAAAENELIHDLRLIFEGGAVWDARVEVG